jgi:CubicO group peptidase (beta-lactamase class C family)
MRLLLSVVFAVLTVFVSLCPAQDKAELIDTYLTSWHEVGRFNGAVLVARGADVIFEKGYGSANLEWRSDNTPDTKFDIGSISKQFTTVIVFQLADEGKLKLDAPLTTYLPDYRADTGSRVTLDHLLRHTSGIPCFLRDAEGGPRSFPMERQFDIDELIRDYMSGDLLFEPGSQYRYSNSGFVILRRVIEKVSGESFERNLQERILQPLGLHDTGLLHWSKVLSKMATGYLRIPGDRMKAKPYFYPNLYGAGAMYSTVRDLHKWNVALRRGGIVPEQYRERMFTPYWNEGNSGYAYSINLISLRIPGIQDPVNFTEFDGAIDGFISNVYHYPQTDYYIVILDNRDTFSHWQISPGIYQILEGLQPDTPLQFADDVIAPLAVAQGYEAAVMQLDELRTQPDKYDFDSIQGNLDWLGYRYLWADRSDAALEIFKLVVAIKPTSVSANRDLAEAYESIGSEEMARGYLETAQEIGDAQRELVGMVNDGRFDAASERIAALRLKYPNGNLLEPYQIGPLFGKAMQEGRSEDALKVCRVWSEADPTEVGPYFSMARIYTQQGKRDLAAQCYRKVLELSPSGRAAESARRALGRLEEQ